MITTDNSTNDNIDLLSISRFRCSVRDYSPRAIEREKLEYILETARLAPSAVNYQPWVFIVIREAENKCKLQSCYNRDWFKSAPAYILVCGNHNESWKRKTDEKDFCDIDVAIATEHLCLAATEQELGTCWVCNFDANLCKKSFNLPDHLEPIVIVPIGYPADPNVFSSTLKKRKAFNEIVKWEKL